MAAVCSSQLKFPDVAALSQKVAALLDAKDLGGVMKLYHAATDGVAGPSGSSQPDADSKVSLKKGKNKSMSLLYVLRRFYVIFLNSFGRCLLIFSPNFVLYRQVEDESTKASKRKKKKKKRLLNPLHLNLSIKEEPVSRIILLTYFFLNYGINTVGCVCFSDYYFFF